MVFSIVVVAKKLLYTTTTSDLSYGLLFAISVGFGLQKGCANIHKQHKRELFDLLIREGEVTLIDLSLSNMKGNKEKFGLRPLICVLACFL